MGRVVEKEGLGEAGEVRLVNSNDRSQGSIGRQRIANRGSQDRRQLVEGTRNSNRKAVDWGRHRVPNQ